MPLPNPLGLLKSSQHPWRFFRAGGFDQVMLRSGADIAKLDELDQKLWVALSCPTTGLEFDSKTLSLIDTDKDGRIRAPEIIAAAKWACSMLKSPDDLLRCSASLPLASINDESPEGKQILSSAKRILANLGRSAETAISVDEVADTQRIFAQTFFNGDGVIPPEAAEDPAVRKTMEEIVACMGSQADRSTRAGVTKPLVDAFFAEAQAHVDWWTKGQSPAVLPLGDVATTAGAATAVKTLRAKVDDFFARCRLAEFDARAAKALNRSEDEFLAIAAKDLTLTSAEISGLPLARVEPGATLPLASGGVNPAWADAVKTMHVLAVKPLLGDRERLSHTEWMELQAKLAPFEGWVASKAGAKVERLGVPRLQEILAGPAQQAIAQMIEHDLSLKPEVESIATVDRLVRYHRDLYRLLNNYVNFRDFYITDEQAVFQAGTLYLDQRSCELCVRVDDMAKHASLAHLSRTYLAYCDVTRKTTNEKMTIAAAFTGGDSDNLMVGRNGIFYDRQGRDWDATITKIVDNPISIRQAFWGPYKRVIRWVEEQIAKRAAAADTAAHEQLTSVATTTGEAAVGGKPKAAPKIDIGVVAALGVAVGGITAAMGALLQGFFSLGYLMPLGVLAIILLISGPSMVIAWLKLRQRNLGPILDANGWAVNARARLNIPFGGSLTRVATLPLGSTRDLADPFADDESTRYKVGAAAVVVVLCLALWYFGAIEAMLPGALPPSGWVQRREEAAQKRALREGELKLQEARKANGTAAPATPASVTPAGTPPTPPPAPVAPPATPPTP